MVQQDFRMNSAYLGEALQWLFPASLRFDRELRDDCSWTFLSLIKTAMLWAWSVEEKMTERFNCAQRLIIHLQADQAKRATSWQSFAEMLRRHTDYLRGILTQFLRQRMAKELPNLWKMFGFVVLGVDGTDLGVPLTQSNQDAFSAKKTDGKRCRRKKQKGKKKIDKGANKKSAVPQILLTTLFVVRLNLPWDWRSGSRGDSERGQLRQMLDDLPENCLIAADAGFVGYDLAAEILGGGAQIAMRVGSNIRLLKKLGYVREKNGIVYLWPDKAARKNQPPLVFRLIVMQGPKHPVYLITSVLDAQKLSDQNVIEIYKARWGIEVYHRHLKQTFGRRKLLSRSSENARIELEWSLLSLWAMGLYASVELYGQEIPLGRLSFASVLSAFREMARDYQHEANPRRTLRILLRRSLLDAYDRTKPKGSRDYPRKKKHKQAGAPDIQIATDQQRNHAKQLKKNP
jgi:hypothetical protein